MEKSREIFFIFFHIKKVTPSSRATPPALDQKLPEKKPAYTLRYWTILSGGGWGTICLPLDDIRSVVGSAGQRSNHVRSTGESAIQIFNLHSNFLPSPLLPITGGEEELTCWDNFTSKRFQGGYVFYQVLFNNFRFFGGFFTINMKIDLL